MNWHNKTRSVSAAVLLGTPTAAMAWLDIIYLWFGVTATNPFEWFGSGLFLLLLITAIGIPLYFGNQPAAVVLWSCRLGITATLLLPPISLLVLFLWQTASDRPDLGMGGLILFNLPLAAFLLAFVMAIIFAVCSQAAQKRLRG